MSLLPNIYVKWQRETIIQCKNDKTEMAVAIFTPRPNSQDFQERTIQLSESVKIGRSVAKVKSAANNLIFDCKVLSRNHAIVWYEGGKVRHNTFLQITVKFLVIFLKSIVQISPSEFRLMFNSTNRYPFENFTML